MGNILPDRWSKVVFTWGIAILVGSLFGYFYETSVLGVFITWGVLALAAIMITSYFTDWSFASGKIVQIFWILAVITMFTLQALAVLNHMFPFMLQYDVYFEWAVLSSIGYIITAFITRSRQMFIAGIFSFFVLPLFKVASLAPYNALLFGIPHSFVLFILAF